MAWIDPLDRWVYIHIVSLKNVCVCVHYLNKNAIPPKSWVESIPVGCFHRTLDSDQVLVMSRVDSREALCWEPDNINLQS